LKFFSWPPRIVPPRVGPLIPTWPPETGREICPWKDERQKEMKERREEEGREEAINSLT
jgi:hypothetical protein